MSTETLFFVLVGAVAVAAAIAMVATTNMVYSALYMVLVFFATAVLYLLYQAPFIALVQVAVYTGGIMVLFLFVIMLIGAGKMSHVENLRWQRPLAVLLAGLLLVETAYLGTARLASPDPVQVAAEFGSPQAVGRLLFSTYLLPFETISILLVSAMVGAVVLTIHKDRAR